MNFGIIIFSLICFLVITALTALIVEAVIGLRKSKGDLIAGICMILILVIFEIMAFCGIIYGLVV